MEIDSPRLFPIETIDDLPELAPQDLAARKILAIIDRAEGRDFTNLALQEQYGRDDCLSWAQQLDAGVTTKAIASAFGQLDRLDDSEQHRPGNHTRRLRQLVHRPHQELIRSVRAGA